MRYLSRKHICLAVALDTSFFQMSLRVSCPQLSISHAVCALLVDGICPDVASNVSEHFYPFKD